MATGDKLTTLDELKLVYDTLHVPSVQVQIPTGQWSGSSTKTYTVNATNVTADTIMEVEMDSSINNLRGDLNVTSGSGTITFTTSTVPSGTINVTVFFPGVKGEVVIQTLADVYSRSQTDQLIAQATASLMSQGTITVASGVTDISSILRKTGNIVSLAATLQRVFTGTAETVTLCTLPAGFRPNQVVRGAAYNGTKDVALVYSIQLNGDVMVTVSPQTVEAWTQNIMINASFGI